MSPSLTVLEHLPEGFLEVAARDLHRLLPGPTLIHLPGRRPEPLFVSILLHGNEEAGLLAMQRVLSSKTEDELPRALSLFVGNVDAARHNQRHLVSQPDYNRVWGAGDTPEHRMMAEVTEQMRRRGVFASIDLHNNTGHNPYYGCVTELRHEDLHLAALFSRTAVYFRQPSGVQTMAFTPLCPAVTCECGRVGDAGGVARAAEFVEAALHLAALPQQPVPAGDLHLFHTVGVVKVASDATFSFDGTDADVRFRPDFDWFNFRELAPGTAFAEGRMDALVVLDDCGRPAPDLYLEQRGAEVVLTRAVMPAMLTLDAQVIRQDCLGYFMERLALP